MGGPRRRANSASSPTRPRHRAPRQLDRSHELDIANSEDSATRSRHGGARRSLEAGFGERAVTPVGFRARQFCGPKVIQLALGPAIAAKLLARHGRQKHAYTELTSCGRLERAKTVSGPTRAPARHRKRGKVHSKCIRLPAAAPPPPPCEAANKPPVSGRGALTSFCDDSEIVRVMRSRLYN